MKSVYRLIIAAVLPLLVLSCASSEPYSPLLRAEPEIGSVQTRVPRTLRLYYDALPDVQRSSLQLLGPAGEHSLRGLHTMAADDLMIEILDPLSNGEYNVGILALPDNSSLNVNVPAVFSMSPTACEL